MPNRRQSHRGDAAALRAVRIPTELAGGNCGFQICGERSRSPGKNTFIGILGRLLDLRDHGIGHVEEWVLLPQGVELVHHGGSYLPGMKERGQLLQDYVESYYVSL